jgi:hypothetical protein
MQSIIAAALVSLALLQTSTEPRITAVAPERPVVSPKEQVLTVTGESFRSGLSLFVTTPGGDVKTISGAAIAAQRDTSFQASLMLDAVGNYSLVVVNADGRKSAPFTVAARRSTGQPWIETVTPEEVTKSQEPQVITLNGRNFAPGLRVSVTNPTGNVTVADTIDRLSPPVLVLRLLFDQAGPYGLMVTNPSGESSNTVVIRVSW